MQSRRCIIGMLYLLILRDVRDDHWNKSVKLVADEVKDNVHIHSSVYHFFASLAAVIAHSFTAAAATA